MKSQRDATGSRNLDRSIQVISDFYFFCVVSSIDDDQIVIFMYILELKCFIWSKGMVASIAMASLSFVNPVGTEQLFGLCISRKRRKCGSSLPNKHPSARPFVEIEERIGLLTLIFRSYEIRQLSSTDPLRSKSLHFVYNSHFSSSPCFSCWPDVLVSIWNGRQLSIQLMPPERCGRLLTKRACSLH